MDCIKEMIKYLKCDCEVIENAKTPSVIMSRYEELLAVGKKEGFTPLIVVPNDILLEAIDFSEAEENETEEIDVSEFLKARIKEAMPVEEEGDYDILGEFEDYDPLKEFSSLINYSTNRPFEAVIIAKIPTTNPWELANWVPMGGWNECPFKDEQAAVFKYWYEKYGAIPGVVQSDIWEMYVENPPTTKEEAVALAWEQFGFCSDIVWQGLEKINILASSLINSKTWYFWWD